MSEPIRPASAGGLAAIRPQVHSRQVSLRLGPFGLTYSTDRVVWNPDAPPVEPAPAVDAQPRSGAQGPPCSFPLDLEAARRQAAQQQAQARRNADRRAPGSDAAARSSATPEARPADGPQAAQGERQQVQTSAPRGPGSLRQAMRQAAQAYLACAQGFTCAAPMLQAVV